MSETKAREQQNSLEQQQREELEAIAEDTAQIEKKVEEVEEEVEKEKVEEGMMEGVRDQRVVRGPMGHLLSDVERDIEHLRSEFYDWSEKHGRKRESKS